MFVWIFHRVSGVILILLMGVKIVTGFGIMGRFGADSIEPMRLLHRDPVIEISLLFLFVYHAVWGLRTILVDLGLRREKSLFWIALLIGTLVFIWLTIIVLMPRLVGLR
jgi:succinate dehydrogenase/fumarate reductase cytochrome b subunit